MGEEVLSPVREMMAALAKRLAEKGMRNFTSLGPFIFIFNSVGFVAWGGVNWGPHFVRPLFYGERILPQKEAI